MSLVTVSIKSDGALVDPEFQLLHIKIMHEFNKVPWAELSYIDGEMNTNLFAISDSATFEPGKKIQIGIGYDSSPAETVFEGVVIRQGLEGNVDGYIVNVELADVAIKMTTVRRNQVFEEKKDSDIMKQLVSESGLKAKVDATAIKHSKLIQYYSTAWDFILTRAEANGLLVSVNDGVVTIQKPRLNVAPVLTLDMNKSELLEFEFEADARNQLSNVESVVWDTKKQALTAAKQAAGFELKQGNLTAGKVAGATGRQKEILVSAVSIKPEEAQAWADARMVKSRMSMLSGRLKVEGTASAHVGDMMKLEGLGKRFSGPTLITAVRHELQEGAWYTELLFGLLAEPYSASAPNIIDQKAAGLLPAVNGLQVGIVAKFEEDPEKENRVKVIIPAISEKSFVWARLASPDAGNKRGLFFLPEPGDEVIIGFLNDDPRQAIIIGSVYSSANTTPIKPADKNPEKGLVTKQGLKMLFNDEKQVVSISTSDDSLITIDGKEKTIVINDANKNAFKLSEQGITLQSEKDIIIKAGANIKIEGKAVEIKGNKVDII